MTSRRTQGLLQRARSLPQVRRKAYASSIGRPMQRLTPRPPRTLRDAVKSIVIERIYPLLRTKIATKYWGHQGWFLPPSTRPSGTGSSLNRSLASPSLKCISSKRRRPKLRCGSNLRSVCTTRTRPPAGQLFNEYFGGGMAGLVFQELREARALAHSAWAHFFNPSPAQTRRIY